MTQHESDLDRIKPIESFMREVYGRMMDGEDIKLEMKALLNNIKYMGFTPLLCIDWSRILQMLLEISDYFPDLFERTNELETYIRKFYHEVYGFLDGETALTFILTSLDELELTECDRLMLTKLLAPEA